ncbi:hypothetical protein [Halorientalis marina]|nr:hypothetical protein [Halorientalis marina]
MPVQIGYIDGESMDGTGQWLFGGPADAGDGRGDRPVTARPGGQR